MTPNPDQRVLEAELRLVIALPPDFDSLDADLQRGVRRAFVQQLTAHPDENDDTRGEKLRKIWAGNTPASNGRPWRNAELVAAQGYPTEQEIKAFVDARLAAYNSELREPAGLSALSARLGPLSDGPSGPTQPRTVRYVIVDGEIVCIRSQALEDANGEPLTVDVDAPHPRSLPVVAEVSYGRAHDPHDASGTGSSPW